MERRNARRRETSLALSHVDDDLVETKGKDPRRPTLRVLRLLPGQTATVSSGCIAVLVQTSFAPTVPMTIKTKQRLVTQFLKSSGDADSVGPGCEVRISEEDEGGTVMYEVPASSFRSFASRSAPNSSINSFSISGPVSDPFLYLLSLSVLPLLISEETWPEGFARYFAMSLYHHLLNRWGTECDEREQWSGGFSPHNKAIVEKALRDSEGGKIAIDTLSELCRLSSRQFARAFQQTFGMPFYKYQLEMRIRRAKHLLITTNLALGTIARDLGYADQATFTESFARLVGLPPGRFRRRQLAYGSNVADSVGPLLHSLSAQESYVTSAEG